MNTPWMIASLIATLQKFWMLRDGSKRMHSYAEVGQSSNRSGREGPEFCVNGFEVSAVSSGLTIALHRWKYFGPAWFAVDP